MKTRSRWFHEGGDERNDRCLQFFRAEHGDKVNRGLNRRFFPLAFVHPTFRPAKGSAKEEPNSSGQGGEVRVVKLVNVSERRQEMRRGKDESSEVVKRRLIR